MRRREGDARAPVASRSVRVPAPREEARSAQQAPRRGPARAPPQYSSEDGDSYSSSESEESRRAPPPRGALKGAAQRPEPAPARPPQQRPAPRAPPPAPAPAPAPACSSLFPVTRPARCAPPLAEVIDRALVPDSDSNAARIAAELARRFPQSFQRLTSQLQPRTRLRLISALKLQDGGERERHGLSSDAVAAWREQAAAAERGPGRERARPSPRAAPRRRDPTEDGSGSDSRDDYGSGSGSESGSSEYDDDEEAEYQHLARIAREWEAAERERAAKEEDAKDLATMMRLCCIAMKPTADKGAGDKGEAAARNNRAPMRQRKDSRSGGGGGSAPRQQQPPLPHYREREAPAVEARREREELQRDTSQNRHRQRGGTGRA